MSRKVKIALYSVLGVVSAIVLMALIFGLVNAISYAALSSKCEAERAIPRLDVITDGGAEILSKEDYVGCTVTLSDSDIIEASAGIRGRGNSTWEYHPKKPYRIKFDEKTSVFSEKKNKSWVLLALYNDLSVVKDRLAFTLGDSIGTDVFVPSYNYVELYINGEYNGIYLMTDQVDENDGRTGVKNNDAIESGSAEIPFLVELDAYAPDEGIEGVDWFYVAGRAYSVKYPEADERYSEEQLEYIRSYIEGIETAANNGDLAALSELVDVDSFIDYYLIQEVMGQPEINWKSVYMYKAVGEKMKMGPLWDFDWSAMGPAIENYEGRIESLRSNGNWFSLMLDGSGEFRALVNARFSEIKPQLLSALDDVANDAERIMPYAKRNHLRWHWYRLFTNPERSYNDVLVWVEERIDWLESYFRTVSAD